MNLLNLYYVKQHHLFLDTFFLRSLNNLKFSIKTLNLYLFPPNTPPSKVIYIGVITFSGSHTKMQV